MKSYVCVCVCVCVVGEWVGANQYSLKHTSIININSDLTVIFLSGAKEALPTLLKVSVRT